MERSCGFGERTGDTERQHHNQRERWHPHGDAERSAVAAPTNTFLTFSVQNSPCGLGLATNIHVLVHLPDPAFSLPDPSLSNQVCEALGQPGGEFTSVDMRSLIALFASGASIQKLSGLQWATNLKALSLDNNAISDLTPIQSLWSLTNLSLYGNLITDLSPLAGLTNLTYLNLGHNPVTNYARAGRSDSSDFSVMR